MAIVVSSINYSIKLLPQTVNVHQCYHLLFCSCKDLKIYGLAWLNTSEIIEIHFKSFIGTAVYDLPIMKISSKHWKSCPNCTQPLPWWRGYWLNIPLLFQTVSSEKPYSLYQWLRRKSNWQCSSREWRESGREGGDNGEASWTSQGRKAATCQINWYRLVCLPHTVTCLSA